MASVERLNFGDGSHIVIVRILVPGVKSKGRGIFHPEIEGSSLIEVEKRNFFIWINIVRWG